MEAIVAIFVITTGLVGILSLVSQTIASSTFSKDKLIAAYLAQEGIEIIRNIRDTNWLGEQVWEGLTSCTEFPSSPCEWEVDYTASTVADPVLDSYLGRFLYIDKNDVDGDGITNFYRYINSPGPDDIQTKFKRKITISDGPISGSSINVKVEVFWQERGTQYEFEAQENLYNWY
jgi:hypothetical protein